MPRFLRLFLMLGALYASGAHADEGVVLSPSEMRVATIIALETGDLPTAIALAEALLKRNPSDHEARILASRAYRNNGDLQKATLHARQAWKASTTKHQRYASALLMAQSLSSDGKRTSAQLWLRRAAEHAPNKRLRKAAVRDFQYVRARNPVAIHLSFGVAPNSNINNGSAHSSVDIFGLPDVNLIGAAQALSGIEYSTGLSLRYRLAQTATRATDLTLKASRRDYTLSAEAKTLAPTAQGTDFALGTVSAGITQRFMQPETRAETTVSLELGKTWYSGSPYSDFTRLSLGHSMPLSNRSRLTFGLAGERTRGPRAPHADLLRISTSWSKALKSGALVGLSLHLTNSQSPSSSAEYQEIAARISYAPAKPLLKGVRAMFGLGLRARDYPVTPYLPSGGRQDREVSADLTLSFENLEYYGFTPTLTFNASSANSNVGLFDVENVGMAMGIRSSF